MGVQLYADVNEEGGKVLPEASKSLAIDLEAFCLKIKKLHEENIFLFTFTLIKLSKMLCRSYLVLRVRIIKSHK